MKHTFSSLASHDYRLYFFGQLVSLIGTWVQQVALSWIAYRVTGSAFMLGLVAFSGQIPMLVATPLGGILADKFDKRKILVVTQLAEMSIAGLLAFLAWQNDFNVWVLLGSSIALGIVGALEMPARFALIPDIVHDPKLMPNAIALNSLSFNVARMCGPAVAGLILAVTSETACFVINTISYIAAIYSLIAIRPDHHAPHPSQNGMAEAIQYFKNSEVAKWLVITTATVSFCFSPFMTFLPVYAKDILKGGPDVLGTLMGASGLGSLIFSLFLANRKSTEGAGKLILLGTLSFSSASILFAYNSLLTVALPLLFLSGGCFTLIATSCNIMLQSLVPRQLRGKVMAVFSMSFIGAMPVGSLVYGELSHLLGSVKPVFVLAGVFGLGFGGMLSKKLPQLKEEMAKHRH